MLFCHRGDDHAPVVQWQGSERLERQWVYRRGWSHRLHSGGRNLITEETFANFVLDFEFKLSPGANNGLGIHYPGTGDAAYTGMEIQIFDSTHPKHKAAGFQRIFNGTTLEGWKSTPDTTNWKDSMAILKHNGKAGSVNHLWTEKSYKDFTLVCDWRWSGRGPMKSQPVVMPDGSNQGTHEIEEFDSGILLRGETKSQVNLWNWSIGSGEVYGYRIDKKSSAEVKAGVTPKYKADRPIGEWNRTMISLKGDRLSVTLNGKLVIEKAQLPGIPATGPIGLQHHGSAIDFANIWLKEE